MKEKSVKFYKQVILGSLATLIAVPLLAALFLVLENGRLRGMLENGIIPDDIVTVGASQFEPAGVVRDKPVLSYQLLYPDFKTEFLGFNNDLVNEKTVFLTFDDGPSDRTAEILDILKRHDVKTTFFVNGKSNRYLTEQLKRTVEEGHIVGMHSYTHRYKTIYSSMENFLDDFYRNYLYIKSETGIAPEILRFPGGSINIFNVSTYQPMISEVLRRGFMYYDWNVSAGDAMSGVTTQDIVNNVLNGVRLCWGPAIVLMHDNGNPVLSAALEIVVASLKNEGYTFKKLDSSIKPPMFVYPD